MICLNLFLLLVDCLIQFTACFSSIVASLKVLSAHSQAQAITGDPSYCESMAQWSVEALEGEILSLAEIHLARPGDDAANSFAESVIFKIQHAGEMSTSTFTRLSNVLKKSTLTSTLKESVQKALDNAIVDSNQGTLKLVARPQSLLSVYNYLTTEELASVRASPLPAMVSTIVKRMKLIGLKSCKESTKKYTVAFIIFILCQRGEPHPTSNEVYKLAQYLADAFNSCQVTSSVVGLSQYPSTPVELGHEFLKKAYGDLTPVEPCPEIASAVAAQLRNTPVRSTSNLLVDSSQSKKSQTSGDALQAIHSLIEAAKSLDLQAGFQKQMQQAPTPVSQQLAHKNSSNCIGALPLARNDSSQSLGVPVTAQEPAKPETKQEQSLEQPALDTKLDAKDDSTHLKGDLETFEQQAFDKLLAKKETKGSGKGKKGSASGLMKRPAASNKVLKKPAVCKPSAQEKSSKDSKGVQKALKAPRPICYGCLRCRGNVHGCSSCQSDSFNGVRLNGRTAWNNFLRSKKGM